jgi:hypothetical protein
MGLQNKKIIILFFIFLFYEVSSGIYCGTERSDIKHLSDKEAVLINFSSRKCSVYDFLLGDTIVIPVSFSSSHIKRLPSECQVYTIECYVKFWILEQDNDYHLVCTDSNYNYKFISEIPSADCSETIASGYAANYKAARILMDSLFPLFHGGKHWSNIKRKFSITGVCFHDFVHGQTGHAPKGIELHPVLSITYDN